MDQDEKFMRDIRFLRNHRILTRGLISDYAAKSDLSEKYKELTDEQKEKVFAQEVLAECRASAKNSKNPPIIHRFFANMLEKRLKRQ